MANVIPFWVRYGLLVDVYRETQEGATLDGPGTVHRTLMTPTPHLLRNSSQNSLQAVCGKTPSVKQDTTNSRS